MYMHVRYDAQDVHVPVITTLYLRKHTCVFMGFNTLTHVGGGLTVAVPFDINFTLSRQNILKNI